jgi:hypothetical protein
MAEATAAVDGVDEGEAVEGKGEKGLNKANRRALLAQANSDKVEVREIIHAVMIPSLTHLLTLP